MSLIAWFFCHKHETIVEMVYHGYTDTWQAISCQHQCQCVMRGRMNPNKVR